MSPSGVRFARALGVALGDALAHRDVDALLLEHAVDRFDSSARLLRCDHTGERSRVLAHGQPRLARFTATRRDSLELLRDLEERAPEDARLLRRR
jgi:hypothetical protein